LAQAILAQATSAKAKLHFGMVFVRVLVAFVLAFSMVAGMGQVATCPDGDCGGEETSLLSLRNVNKTTKSTGQCKNRFGVEFPCGDGECCGDICRAQGDLCCKNSDGQNFPCGGGGSCCGNACAASGSKCCTGANGYKYPAADCSADDYVECTNTRGHSFLCAAGNSCCGDICVAEGGACCQNAAGSNFPCGAGSRCCGNACAAEGSKCCNNNGAKYPVSQATQCASTSKPSVECTNRYGDIFPCGAGSSCCGDLCAGSGSGCCKNSNGHNFVCAPGTTCCGDACC